MLEVIVNLHPSSGAPMAQLLKVKMINVHTSTDNVAEYDVYTGEGDNSRYRGTVNNFSRNEGPEALVARVLGMIGGGELDE